MTVDEFRQLMSQNWLGSALGIISLIATVIFGAVYSFKPRPRMATQINTLELLGRDAALPAEIEFLFKGNKVPKVAMSRVAILNSGNVTINGEQIVIRDPLRITTTANSAVLEATVTGRTREVNDFSCAVRRGTLNEVECRFDYLDPNDGALIQLIHTGDKDVKVVGTLRGLPKGVREVRLPTQQRPQEPMPLAKARKFGRGTVIVGVVIAVCSGVIALVWPTAEGNFLLATAGFTVILMGLLMVWSMKTMPPNELSTQITSGPAEKRP